MHITIINDTNDIEFSTDGSVDNTAFINGFLEYLEANPEDPIMDEIRQGQEEHDCQDSDSDEMTEGFIPHKKAI
jgi:hypothetical protein